MKLIVLFFVLMGGSYNALAWEVVPPGAQFSEDISYIKCESKDCTVVDINDINPDDYTSYAIADIEKASDRNISVKGAVLTVTAIVLVAMSLKYSIQIFDPSKFTMTDISRGGPSMANKVLFRLSVLGNGLVLGKILNRIESHVFTFGGKFPNGIFTETGVFLGGELYDFVHPEDLD